MRKELVGVGWTSFATFEILKSNYFGAIQSATDRTNTCFASSQSMYQGGIGFSNIPPSRTSVPIPSSSLLHCCRRIIQHNMTATLSNSSVKRGVFIVFEGADRSGKTTQTRRLATYLRESGKSVVEDAPWRFPDRTTATGHMIDAYLSSKVDLDDHALHLLFSANRWEKAERIREALSRGESVIVDRYAFSGVAYSVAKGLSIEWCKAPDAGLPAPDIVIFLNLNVEAARRRGDFGSERYENREMQISVSNAFTKLNESNWRIIDADADEDTVFARILEAIHQALNENLGLNDIKTLWV